LARRQIPSAGDRASQSKEPLVSGLSGAFERTPNDSSFRNAVLAGSRIQPPGEIIRDSNSESLHDSFF
jgi:hypothetical protein